MFGEFALLKNEKQSLIVWKNKKADICFIQETYSTMELKINGKSNGTVILFFRTDLVTAVESRYSFASLKILN